MVTNKLPRLNALVLLVVAVIGLGVLADGVLIVTHLQASPHSQAPTATTETGATNGAHPCNHGFYVSQAAHAKKGGGYVKQVAQSNLGKNGSCSAPLPAPASNTKPTTGEADD